MGEARFTMTEADIAAAARIGFRAALTERRVLLMIGLVAAFWSACVILPGLGDPAPVDWALLAGLVAAAILFVPALYLLAYLLAPRRALRQWRQMRLAHGEYRVRWDDQALGIETDVTQARLPWSLFHGWALGPGTLLLQQSDRMANAIPRRALSPGDLDSMIAALRRAGVPERRLVGALRRQSTQSSPIVR